MAYFPTCITLVALGSGSGTVSLLCLCCQLLPLRLYTFLGDTSLLTPALKQPTLFFNAAHLKQFGLLWQAIWHVLIVLITFSFKDRFRATEQLN